MGDLVNVLNHGEFKAKKEATWAVTNLTSGGKPHQMMKLIELGVIEPLISMLGCNDIKIVQVIIPVVQGSYAIMLPIRQMIREFFVGSNQR